MSEVDLIDLDARYVLMTDGKVLQITTFLDSDGDETDDPSEATVCVAGEDGYGWLTIEIFAKDAHPVGIH